MTHTGHSGKGMSCYFNLPNNASMWNGIGPATAM